MIAKNIKFLRGDRSQEEFGKLIEATRGQIASYESGDAKPKVLITGNICKLFNITPEELLTVDLSKPEYVKKFMSSNALQKVHVPHYTANEPESSYSPSANQHGERKNMTIVPLKAVGGFLMGYKNKVYLDSLEHSSFPLIKGPCFRFEVEGYSMMPTYPPQSHVICTPVEKIEDMRKNKDYVITTNDDLVLKRFSMIEGKFCHIFSLNKEYDGIKPIPLKEINGIYLVELQIINPYR